jgi:hypothetical protein
MCWRGFSKKEAFFVFKSDHFNIYCQVSTDANKPDNSGCVPDPDPLGSVNFELSRSGSVIIVT